MTGRTTAMAPRLTPVSSRPAGPPAHASDTKEEHMIALGIILLVIGLLVASLHVLFTIGVVLLVGVILAILGRTGRAVAGRKHWW